MLNIEALLAPVTADNPCGEDLAFAPEVDEIARARLADDPSLEQGAWVTALKEADWKFVGKRCAHLIEGRSKDLQLAVWLAEANARTGGVRGLADGLGLLAALCARYWDDGLHPQPDEDGHERRIGNLAWIAGRIASLLKTTALDGGALSLQAWEAARVRGPEARAELEAARARLKPEACQALLDDGAACLAALDELEQNLDALLGVDGPSLNAGRTALHDVIDLLTPGVPVKGGAVALAGADAQVAGLAIAPSRHDGPVMQRDQALAQLRQVAEFFRRTEPHSPVAYLAEKAARWGEQPLHAWLRSVIKDDVSLARLEELLGIEHPAQ